MSQTYSITANNRINQYIQHFKPKPCNDMNCKCHSTNTYKPVCTCQYNCKCCHNKQQLPQYNNRTLQTNHTSVTQQSIHHNLTTNNTVDYVQQYMSHKYTKQPLIVTVTGACGNIAYSLLWCICTGQMLGLDQPIILRLLEIPKMITQLRALIAELQDSILPLVVSITGTTDYKTAFIDTDIVLLLGGKPKQPGIKRRVLLHANMNIFSAQGAALNVYAKRGVKVCVLATPALTNALIAQSNAPDLPSTAFTALTRLDCNRAIHQISIAVGCHSNQVKNIVIFGNGSKTQYPHINDAYIVDYPDTGKITPVKEAINDDQWLSTDFISLCIDRGHRIQRVKQKTTAASAAIATCMHISDWLYGTNNNEIVSMGVLSDGSYNVPKNIFFSFPVTCHNGEYKIVNHLHIDEFGRQRIDDTIKELQNERDESLQ